MAPRWHQAEVRFTDAILGVEIKTGLCEVMLTEGDVDRLKEWLTARNPNSPSTKTLHLGVSKVEHSYV